MSFKGDPQPPPPPSVFGQQAWTPAAESISIHPATRATVRGEQRVLDVRVRLIDALGDYTKASGQWRFELHAVEGRQTEGNYTLLGLWNDKVLSLPEHRMHFDAATRSYRFQLPVEQALPSKPLRLLAVFTAEGNNYRIADELDIQMEK